MKQKYHLLLTLLSFGSLFLIICASQTNAESSRYLYGNRALAVDVQDNYAYVAYLTELGVIDVTDKFNPAQVGMLPLLEPPNDLQVQGDFAYLGDESSVMIVNISDPTLPFVAKIIPETDVQKIHLVDDSLYIGALTDFVSFDVTDPTNPVEMGRYQVAPPAMYWFSDLIVAGNYVFAVRWMPDVTVVLDISDPSMPTEITTLNNYGPQIVVQADKLYNGEGICGPTCTGVLSVHDITDIKNPEIISSFQVWSDRVYELELEGVYAYMVSGTGYYVFNIANATDIQVVDTQFDYMEIRDVVVADGYAYLATDLSGLQIIAIPTTYYNWLPIAQ